MAAMGETLKAKTKKELISLVAAFRKEAKKQGFTMQVDYDPARVKKTKDGFEISLRAHS
jgi:hypothetical protein